MTGAAIQDNGTSATSIPLADRRQRARWYPKRAALALAATSVLAAAGLSVVYGNAAEASPNPAKATSCPVTSVAAPIMGSWYVQAYFPGQPFPGETENLEMTLSGNGGVSESTPVNPHSSAGSWQLNADCTYTVHTADFFYDTNHGVKLIANVRVTYVLSDYNHLRETAITAIVSFYDSHTGSLLPNSPGGGPNPLTQNNYAQLAGQRITADWQAPNQLPAMP